MVCCAEKETLSHKSISLTKMAEDLLFPVSLRKQCAGDYPFYHENKPI